MRRHFLGGAVLALAAAAAHPACADTIRFHAELRPDAEVPPVQDGGSGAADATLETGSHVLTYDLTFSGFAQPVTMAHFHGPAASGANAGVVVPLGTSPTSPVHGTLTLTAEQQAQLVGGLWYANVHTAAHPKGAARGQMLKQPGAQ